jgi:hypothetical protein
MNEIENIDLELIGKLCRWEISKEEFLSQTSFKASDEQWRYLLNGTKNKVNESGYNQYFDVIFLKLPTSISKIDKIDIFKTYLLVNWHHEHEEIVGVFQSFFHNDIDNISVLLQAMKQIPQYIEEIDSYPYIRKIIYAIGAQPEPYNIETLKKIINETQDETIKGLALHQVDKREKFGRWEFEKNKAHEST